MIGPMTAAIPHRWLDLPEADRRHMTDRAIVATRRGCAGAELVVGEEVPVASAAERLRRDAALRRRFRANLRRAEAGFAALAVLDPAHSYPQLGRRVWRLRAIDVAVDAGAPAPAPATWGGRRIAQ